MTLNEGMNLFWLPENSTKEDIEGNWSRVLTFGNKVVLAGYYYKGKNQPRYYGATYEFASDDHNCDAPIVLRAVSEVEFEDDGHAIAWAIAQ